jgi:hypothetical protein
MHVQGQYVSHYDRDTGVSFIGGHATVNRQKALTDWYNAMCVAAAKKGKSVCTYLETLFGKDNMPKPCPVSGNSPLSQLAQWKTYVGLLSDQERDGCKVTETVTGLTLLSNLVAIEQASDANKKFVTELLDRERPARPVFDQYVRHVNKFGGGGDTGLPVVELSHVGVQPLAAAGAGAGPAPRVGGAVVGSTAPDGK